MTIRERVPEPSNPLGVDGLEFVEYATSQPQQFGALLQQMGQFVSASAAAGGFDQPDSHMTRTSLRIDEQGWKELAEATRTWLSDAERIGKAAAERLEADAARDGDGDGPTRTMPA